MAAAASLEFGSGPAGTRTRVVADFLCDKKRGKVDKELILV